ncbi:MAG: glycosyltransferase [Planctomycetes bacterium]|nr:glycosyltransferase [Planctomycetota bacterium]
MTTLFVVLGVLLVLERLWKHVLVVRFFRRPRPAPTPPTRISILQPVVSGDPHLESVLERTLTARSRHARQVLWLADEDDTIARELCARVAARHPEVETRIVVLGPPPERASPKMFKLISAAPLADGDVLCVLDDDTALGDDAFDEVLPRLEEPGVGLVFGLPYYTSFENAWSSLVACFVNRNALPTYVPYTFLIEPFTINGMFYVLKRATYERMGGFHGLEAFATDDFAVARHVREHGFRLAQSALRHPIRTHVTDWRQYARLLQRWFVFPRETLYRGLRWRELAVVYLLAFAPAIGPLVFLAGFLAAPSAALAVVCALYVLQDVTLFAHQDRAYLGGPTPLSAYPLVVLGGLLLPFQVLFALVAPQRVNWRGNVMQIHKGGTFDYVRRRGAAREAAR